MFRSAAVVEHILDALGDGGQHGVVHDQVQTGQDQGAQDDGDQHSNRHIQRTLTGAVGQRRRRAVGQLTGLLLGSPDRSHSLNLSVADEVWMLENAYYSVITPESCASILFKDPKRAPEAAEHLKLTAADLNKMGIVEKVVEEPEDFSEEKETSHFMKKLADDLSKEIKQLEKKPVDKLLDDRYEKYRKIGRYSEYSEAVGEVPGAAQLLGVSQAPARKRRGLFGRG